MLVFHVLDDDELDFRSTARRGSRAWNCPTHLRCNPRALREGYLAALGAYLEEVRRGCARHNVDYALLRTSQPLDAALAAYLSNRLGMHHQELNEDPIDGSNSSRAKSGPWTADGRATGRCCRPPRLQMQWLWDLPDEMRAQYAGQWMAAKDCCRSSPRRPTMAELCDKLEDPG